MFYLGNGKNRNYLGSIFLLFFLLILGGVLLLRMPQDGEGGVGGGGNDAGAKPVSKEVEKVSGGKRFRPKKGEGIRRKEILEGVYCLLRVVERDSGRPIQGAGVYKTKNSTSLSLRWADKLGNTDEGGGFKVFDDMFRPDKETLFVHKDGFRVETVQAPNEGKEVLVALGKGSTLDVYLVTPLGKPVSGVHVALSCSSLGNRLDLLEGKRPPGVPVKAAFTQVVESDKKGRCRFKGLAQEKKYVIEVLSRTLAMVDLRPPVPKGNSGRVTIKLAPLFGIWAKLKGDVYEQWELRIPPSFKKRFKWPRGVDFSLITRERADPWGKSILYFVVPAYRKDGTLEAPLPEGDVTCDILLARKGWVKIPLKMRRVTQDFAPQVIDVSGFQDDPRMGKVRLALRNRDGSFLPFTDGSVWPSFSKGVIKFLVRSVPGDAPKRSGKKHRLFIWPLSKRPHFLPEGPYSIQSLDNPRNRMLREYMAEKTKFFRVEGGREIVLDIRMRKQIVPLRFKFFGPGNQAVSYGVLSIIPSSLGNMSKMVERGRVSYVAPDFIWFSMRAYPGTRKVEDVICYAPEGEEVILKFRPDKVYGLEEFQKRITFFKSSGILFVKCHVGRKR